MFIERFKWFINFWLCSKCLFAK